MDNKVVFRALVKSPWEGELPIDELRHILQTVEKTFYGIGGKNKGKPIEGVRLLAKVIAGSCAVECRTISTDETPTSEGDNRLRLLQRTLTRVKEKPTEMALTPEERKIIINFREMFEMIGKKYPVTTAIGDNILELDDLWNENAENLTKSELQEKEVALWGKLMEGDFRLGKYSCKLVLLTGEVMACKYSHEMEDVVAKHLQPLKRDVVVKGIERKEAEKNPVLHIVEIIPQTDLFNMDKIPTEKKDPDRFLGIIADVEETADELTEKMIKATWGDE